MVFYRTWQPLRSSGSSRSNTPCTSGHTPAPPRPPAPTAGIPPPECTAAPSAGWPTRPWAVGGWCSVLGGVRRFFCDHPDCQARTFTEQLPGLTSRYARRTVLLRRLLGALPDPKIDQVTVLGVDLSRPGGYPDALGGGHEGRGGGRVR